MASPGSRRYVGGLSADLRVWVDRTGRDLLGGETWLEFIDGHRLRKAAPDLTHLQAPSGTWLWATGLVTAGVL